MTANELLNLRRKLCLTQPLMANKLNTPLSTYQDWEYGYTKEIPGVVEVACRVLTIEDRITMTNIVANIMDRLERNHPNGIASERIAE